MCTPLFILKTGVNAKHDCSGSVASTSTTTCTQTPTRNLAVFLNSKSSDSPNIGHVLSFHQKVSPSAFHRDLFTSFAIRSDTPSVSHASQLYAKDWTCYSPDSSSGRPEIFSSLSDGISLSDSDTSSLFERQRSVLEATHAKLSVAKSILVGNNEGRFLDSTKEAHDIDRYLASRRSKSLSILVPSRGDCSVTDDPESISSFQSLQNMEYHSKSLHASSRPDFASDHFEAGSFLADLEFVNKCEDTAQNGGKEKKAILKKLLRKRPLQHLRNVVLRVIT